MAAINACLQTNHPQHCPMIQLSGHIVDVVAGRIYDGIMTLEDGIIRRIEPAEVVDNQYLVPGLIDAHVHIESSMMLPSEFARLALPHGTVACVSDPHEIANVCGVAGIDYLIDNSKTVPLKFYFGAPSCVPATAFETSGATLDAEAVKSLLQRNDIHYLGEMMNFPGVLYSDEQVLLKLAAAKEAGKPIDGHAPDLSGDDLRTYVNAGIKTDHECMTVNEALEKIALGMHILIREGSAARNFDTLIPLIASNPERIMLCSDDKHPDDLLKNGHINSLVVRALKLGYDPITILRACSLNPIKHYKLDVGLLQPGDKADFLIVDNLQDFRITSTWIEGQKVAEKGQVLFERIQPQPPVNAFEAAPITAADLRVEQTGNLITIIVAEDGQLYTRCEQAEPLVVDNNLVSDTDRDLLKLVVYNRYEPAKPAIGFIKNIGLKRGALVSTVAHDSHNIVAVGTSDELLAAAINRIISSKGGILAMDETEACLLPLPVGGILSDADGHAVAQGYEQADALAKAFGSPLRSPFMTLAFMSLACIPEIKLTDKGLFEIMKLSYTDLQC